MIFHENRLLADDSHETSYLILFEMGKMSQNLSSSAVVIGALRVKFKKMVHSNSNFNVAYICWGTGADNKQNLDKISSGS